MSNTQASDVRPMLRKPHWSTYVIFRIATAPSFAMLITLAVVVSFLRYVAPRLAERLKIAGLRVAAGLLLRLNGVRLKVSGIENLGGDPATSRVLMANHNSRLDGYIFCALLPFTHKTFWSTTSHVLNEGYSPVVWASRKLDLFFTHDKTDRRRTAKEFRRAETWVAEGHTLVFFPEGSYSPESELHDLGNACTNVACRAGADIYPVYISGSSKGFETGTHHIFRPANVTVRFLTPIAAIADNPKERAALHERTTQALANAIGLPGRESKPVTTSPTLGGQATTVEPVLTDYPKGRHDLPSER